jgi:hypothetical protein
MPQPLAPSCPLVSHIPWSYYYIVFRLEFSEKKEVFIVNPHSQHILRGESEPTLNRLILLELM